MERACWTPVGGRPPNCIDTALLTRCALPIADAPPRQPVHPCLVAVGRAPAKLTRVFKTICGYAAALLAREQARPQLSLPRWATDSGPRCGCGYQAAILP